MISFVSYFKAGFMEDLHKRVEEMYARMTVEDDEGGGLLPPDLIESRGREEQQWSAIGRFLTDRPINVLAMKNIMAAVWRPVKGVWIKELGPNLFIFQFFHELDLERVINGGPWTFEQHLLIFSKLETGMNPMQMDLVEVDFWVQVHDLPVGYMSERIARDIGNYVGKFIEADANNFTGMWKSYMRLRVRLDVRNQLKRRMKIRK